MITPLFKIWSGLDVRAKVSLEWYRSLRGGRRTMVIALPAGMVFPAGTPRDFSDGGRYAVRVYRGQVNHFHMLDDGSVHPATLDPDGYAVAWRPDGGIVRMGPSRKILKKFLATHPPIDSAVQAYRLRLLVRAGD